MDRKFYTENFEKLLKDNADEYKMYPSKKVWHGIYNDLHPGRRWPSTTMSIIFLFTLVIIGHLNTGTDLRNRIASTYPAETITSKITSRTLNAVSKATQVKVEELNSPESRSADESMSELAVITPIDNSNETSNNHNEIGNNKSDDKITKPDNDHLVTSPITSSTILSPEKGVDQTLIDQLLNKETRSDEKDNVSIIRSEMNPSIENSPKPVEKNLEKSKTSPKKHELTESEKQELIAASLRQKNKERISWTYYITPSVSYRKLIDKNVDDNNNTVTGATPPLVQNILLGSAPDHRAFLGLEAGASVNYKLSEKLKIKAGLQLNYSAYRIKANNTHPTLATLILNSPATGTPYTLSAVSLYGNKTGVSEVTLHNYSVQLSTPVGFEYLLGGNDHLQFNVAGTFSPSYVLRDRSYVLSTNKLNYMKDNSLMRNWNMSTNLGAFISFQSNSWNWQIGPQLHYQLKSTYTNNYPLREHLVDYGIRVGVSKLLQ